MLLSNPEQKTRYCRSTSITWRTPVGFCAWRKCTAGEARLNVSATAWTVVGGPFQIARSMFVRAFASPARLGRVIEAAWAQVSGRTCREDSRTSRGRLDFVLSAFGLHARPTLP